MVDDNDDHITFGELKDNELINEGSNSPTVKKGNKGKKKTPQKKKTNTPKKSPIRYSESFADYFCDLMVEHSLEVKTLCAKFPDATPSFTTIYKWSSKYPYFETALIKAREHIVSTWLDDLIALEQAECPPLLAKDEMRAYYGDMRLRIDILKFKLAKIAHMITEKYKNMGKSTVEHTGEVASFNFTPVSYAVPKTDKDS